MSKRVSILIAVLVMVVLLSTAIAVIGLYSGNTAVPNPVTKPFAFNLNTNPNNGTVLQAQNLTIQVDTTYLEGQPEPITLQASGGPNGTLYQFSNQTGTPNHRQQFSSLLTIVTPDTATSETYIITISATTNNTKNQALFNLTIINSQI